MKAPHCGRVTLSLDAIPSMGAGQLDARAGRKGEGKNANTPGTNPATQYVHACLDSHL